MAKKCKAFQKYLISKHAHFEHLSRIGVTPKRHGYSDAVIAVINRAIPDAKDNNNNKDKKEVSKLEVS